MSSADGAVVGAACVAEATVSKSDAIIVTKRGRFIKSPGLNSRPCDPCTLNIGKEL
jgi:hypothetical protein